MKKKTFKLLFLFFFIFLTFAYVKAADGELVCNPDKGKEVDIIKNGIKPTGWKSKLPICAFKTFTGNYSDAGEFDSLSAAWNHRLDKTVATFESADAKSTENTEVTVCSDPKARVKSVTTCKTTTKLLKTSCVDGSYTSYTNDGNCTEITPTGIPSNVPKEAIKTLYSCPTTTCYCNGNKVEETVKTCCPEGYSEDDGECVKIETFTAFLEASNGKVEDLKTGDKEKGIEPTPGKDGNGVDTDYGTWSGDHANWKCDTRYFLQCPIYVCTKEYKVLDTCVPTYKLSDGSPAYCVNPSNGFNGKYQVDKEFDVNKCASSFSTIDCGYANILIEAEYHRKIGETVEDEAINLAMRIWGAHSGQRGYEKTGVANVTGCNCSNPVLFLTGEDGEIVNIYMYMKRYLKEHFESIAHTYDYIPPNNGKLGSTTYDGKLGEISCENIGLTCGSRVCSSQTGGGNDIIYRKSIDLFFNTLIGNKEMINHLNYVVGNVDGEPDGVHVIQGEEVEGKRILYFELDYDDINKIELEEVVYDCDELRNTPQEQLDVDKQKILPYCKTVIYLVDEEGHRLTDEDGNPINPEAGIKVKECKKGSGCITEEFSYAVCSKDGEEKTPINIKMYYIDNTAPAVIQKYQSCANANVNQVMFGVVRDKIEDDEDGDPETGRRYEEETHYGEKQVTVNVYCDKVPGKCNESSINSSEHFGSCFKREQDKMTLLYDGETYTNYVRDPSLKCIVNMGETSKAQYDYSDHFGVNSNLCRIYCSDEVDFILANKINATAGETFSYDIELAAYKSDTRSTNNLLSSVIKEKRTCVSQIYYKTKFPEDALEKIKRDYNLSDVEAANSENIAKLLNTLMHKSVDTLPDGRQKEGGRKEVVNQILFDLYNCNIYAGAFDSNIKTPKNTANSRVGIDAHGNKTKYVKVADYIEKYLYGAAHNNYGLSTDCKINKSTGENTCINMDGLSYEFGAETDTGKIDFARYNYDIDSLKTGINSTRYCHDGNNCLDYTGTGKQDYNYNNNHNWSNNSHFATPTFFGTQYTIPDNDYAMFDVYISIGMYNKERYQVKPGNGIVIDLATSEEDTNYITLDPYKYPISKNALTFDKSGTICTKLDDQTKRCEVSQVLGANETATGAKVFTYYRKLSYDEFFRKVNSSNNTFKCVVDVKIPRVTSCKDCSLDISTIFRNVSEAKMFPNGVIESSNWATVEGQIATNIIESTSDQLRTTDNLKEYSVTLTYKNIEALREYNKSNPNYMSEEIFGCEKVDDIYKNCKSNFLEILRGNTTELGYANYATLDPEYNGSKIINP